MKLMMLCALQMIKHTLSGKRERERKAFPLLRK